MSEPPLIEQTWLTVEEVATALRVSRVSIYRLVQRSRIASTRVGSSVQQRPATARRRAGVPRVTAAPRRAATPDEDGIG